MYLIDTCTVSDFIKGEKNTLNKIKNINPHCLFLSTVSYMEIEYGLQKNFQKANVIRGMLEDFINAINVIEFGSQEAKFSGAIRADLMNKGTPIGPYDLLIAATAVSRKLILVTSNVKEFQRVQNLTWENWRV